MDFIRFITFSMFVIKTKLLNGVAAENSDVIGMICNHDKKLADWFKREHDFMHQHSYPRTTNVPSEPHPGYMTYHINRGKMSGDLKQAPGPQVGKIKKSGNSHTLNATVSAELIECFGEGCKSKTHVNRKRKLKLATTAPTTSSPPSSSNEVKKDESNNSTEIDNEVGEIEYYDYGEDEPEALPAKLKLSPGKPSSEVQITQDEYVRTVINRKEQT